MICGMIFVGDCWLVESRIIGAGEVNSDQLTLMNCCKGIILHMC